MQARFDRAGLTAGSFVWHTEGDAVSPRASGDRVEYERDGIVEWYAATPRGLEQSFRIDRRPDGDLIVRGRIELGGEAAHPIPDGIVFGSLRYTELRAWDAEHRPLSASMYWAQDSATVSLIVPASELVGARFPVTLDPLLATQSWTTDPTDITGAQYAWAVAPAGDFNRDGYADVVVGAPGWDSTFTNEGRAYLFYGGAAGLSVTPAWTADPADQNNAFFGFAVAGAGDVDHDGYADIVIGARGVNAEAAGEGRIYVYRGSASGPVSPPITRDPTDQAGAHFGAAVASAGDVNNDGYGDIIVGAPEWDGASTTNEGKAFVYRGTPSGLEAAPFWQNDPTDEDGAAYGYSVASAGDVNGDGRSDIVVGAPYWGANDEGRAYVYHSGAGGPTGTTEDWKADPTDQTNAQYGFAVAGGGDVNGDGYADVAVGAPGWDTPATYTDEGRVYLYNGSSGGLTGGTTFDPADQNDAFFGQSVAGAGDVNGDGLADLVVGAPRWDGTGAQEGRAWLYLGRSTGSPETTWTADPTNTTDAFFGGAVAAAGDVNGDGFADVLVGAYQANGSVTGEGRAYVFHGYAGGLEATQSFSVKGNQTSGNYGMCSEWAGDVNGDGWIDLLVGEPGVGKIHLYYGTANGVVTAGEWTVTNASMRFGQACAGVGDINGDGYADFVVGAPSYNSNEGRAYVYYGSGAGPTAGPILDDATALGDQFGGSLAGGDFNGDGYADIVVGQPGCCAGAIGSEGRVSVYSGGVGGPAFVFASDPTNLNTTWFGRSVAGVGDVDGDGLDDFVVGAPSWDTGSAPNDVGRAYLYLGKRDLASLAVSWTANPTGVYAEFGAVVAGAGDVNGDGLGDVVVGAPSWYNGSSTVGRAYVFHGTKAGTGLAASPNRTLDGVVPVRFGAGVAGLGDVNGDGYEDIAVGDSQYNGTGRIAAYLGSATGIPATEFWSYVGPLAGSDLGAVLAGGDGDGDGFGDLIAGSRYYDNGIFANCCEEGRIDVFSGGDKKRGLSRQLAQYQSDGATRIAVGGRAPSGTVVLEGRAVEEIGPYAALALEFEVKRVGTPFNGAGTTISAQVGAGQKASVTVSGLTSGASYHWRARVVHPMAFGTGHWTPFGGNTEPEADFRVPALAQGTACTSNVECATGYCVDGVCCNTACGNGASTDCQACSKAKGAAVNGSCGVVQDTAVVCRAAADLCDAPETCDGFSLSCPIDGYAPAGTECRASTGTCDVAEKCSGTSISCPVDAYASSSTQCRAAAGTCDVAEKCTGSAPTCPADAKISAGTQCRASGGVCDVAEKCDGSSVDCPSDAFSPVTTVCRSAAGACDAVEYCTGSAAACPSDSKLASGTECRAVAGPCDVAETCDGSSNACPADGYQSTSTVCRAAGGPCDVAETCIGFASCPPDVKVSKGTECRASGGACDVAESCDGTSNACPADAFASSSTVCRASSGVCDVDEKCSGSSASCPSDAKVVAGTECRASAGSCDVAEKCDGSSGACPSDAKVSAGTECRASAGVCDVAEQCDGSSTACPTDGFASSTTVCRTATGLCDAVEKCSGSSAACPSDGKLASGTECRAPAGPCDVAEQCDGSSNACPTDAFAGASTVCRASAGPCDADDKCSGTSAACPADAKVTAGTECRASAGACDVAEKCDGSAAACPADAKVAVGTECRASGGVCDVAEKCDGSAAACPADAKVAAGTECRASGGVCDVAEKCDGTAVACPVDLKVTAGTECRASAGLCDVAEKCDGSAVGCPADAKVAVGTECRAPAGLCDVAEKCDGTAAACPSDGFAAATVVCRGSTGPCDVAESCTGLAAACPGDAKKSAGTECRAAVGACDVAEQCDGTSGSCPSDAFAGSAVSCRASSCANGTETQSAACGGTDPNCPAPTTVGCGNFVCGTDACLTSCTVDSNCVPTAFCSNGQCIAKLGNGAKCSASTDCVLGHCVDGVCCNTSCVERCEACDVQGSEGTCKPISGQPHGARAPCTTSGTACDGTCNGTDVTGCTYPDTTTECGSPSCTSGVATLAAKCKGDGTCGTALTQSCGLFACAGTQCGGDCSNDSQCQSGNYCSAGVCTPKLDDSGACTSDSQCKNGHCVDGLCCNDVCSGRCEACDVSGFEGTCTAVSGAPHGGRAQCAGLGDCVGSCNGTDRTACVFPDSTQQCASGDCTNGVETDPATCDGAGSCSAPATADCSPYACGTGTCLTSCTGDGDCSNGTVCIGSQCLVPGAGGAGGAGGGAVGGAGGAAGSSGARAGGAGGTSGAATSAAGTAGTGTNITGGTGGTSATGGSGAVGNVDVGGGGAAGGVAITRDQGGCGCELPRRSRSDRALWLALGVAAWVARRRRRIPGI